MCSREFILTMSTDPCCVGSVAANRCSCVRFMSLRAMLLFVCCFRPWLGVFFFLEGLSANKSKETESNNRSVMPLDVLGCTRVTMPGSTGYYTSRVLLRKERVNL